MSKVHHIIVEVFGYHALSVLQWSQSIISVGKTNTREFLVAVTNVLLCKDKAASVIIISCPSSTLNYPHNYIHTYVLRYGLLI